MQHPAFFVPQVRYLQRCTVLGLGAVEFHASKQQPPTPKKEHKNVDAVYVCMCVSEKKWCPQNPP